MVLDMLNFHLLFCFVLSTQIWVKMLWNLDEFNGITQLPQFLHGIVDDQPVLPAPGEVFVLRKLLPQTHTYDFNVHIMDFQPGEHLFVKVCAIAWYISVVQLKRTFLDRTQFLHSFQSARSIK